MSNKLRKAQATGRKDRLNQRINQLEQQLQQLQTVLVNTMYTARFASANLSNFVSFLVERGVFTERDYELFLEEIKRKSELAQEIIKDESLTQEEKIAKAREKDIPEEWVKEPSEATEDTPEESPSGRIIRPSSRIITP
jgi:hypothetical protein